MQKFGQPSPELSYGQGNKSSLSKMNEIRHGSTIINQRKKKHMNYRLMEQKISKYLNGELKQTKDIIFDPVNAHHKYENNKIGLKKVYN